MENEIKKLEKEINKLNKKCNLIRQSIPDAEAKLAKLSDLKHSEDAQIRFKYYEAELALVFLKNELVNSQTLIVFKTNELNALKQRLDNFENSAKEKFESQ